MKMRVCCAVALVAAAGGSALATVSIWDTGAPQPVLFNGASTNLGFSSGNLGAGVSERWSAIPFRVANAGGVVITEVDLDYFIAAGAVPVTVNYIIWSRTGLNAPANGDQVSAGSLGAAAAGTDDPRTAALDDWFHTYSGLNIALGAGDYYLTVYGAGAGPNDSIAWMTGANMQDESLEQAFQWRSATFPSPGFTAYAPANIAANPGQDPEDIWNTSFALRGELVPAPGSLALLGLGLVTLRRRR